MNRKTLVALGAVLVAVAVAVPVVVADNGKPEPEFAALKRPKTAEDHLVLKGEAVGKIDAPAARKVGQTAKAEVFLSRAAEQMTCIVAVDAEGQTYGCWPTEDLQENVQALGWALGPEGTTAEVAVLVPDAYSEVEIAGKTIKAKNNVALTTLRPGSEGKVKLKGAGAELEDQYSLGG